MKDMQKSTYRPDIDGLRAIAVLSVAFYHYGATWLPGGFTGVDIFFVISGFLITSILRREIEAGEFSVLRFYDRRARRILPALLTVLAATMLAGWFLLMPGDYADLGESAAYAAFGLGNLFFYWNTGYFDQTADLHPLLHTWSLGVEEQFYLVWPVALLALFRLTKSAKGLAITGALVITGFAYAVFQTSLDPKAAFYLPHPRAWELGIGALLAFAPKIKGWAASEALRLGGVVLIAYSLLAVTSVSIFPGLNALYACLGAACLIWPSEAETKVGQLLSLRPVVAVGLISYSLYLWHWPVLVLYRHFNFMLTPTAQASVALLAVTLGLSFLSYRYVEVPARKHQAGPLRVLPVGIVSALAMGAAGVFAATAAGFPARIPTEMQKVSNLAQMWEWQCPQTITVEQTGRSHCAFGAPWESAAKRVVLWGDSNGEHLAPLVAAAAAPFDASILMLPGCSPAIGGPVQFAQPGFAPECALLHEDAMAILTSGAKIEAVVLSSLWVHWAPMLQGSGGDTEQGMRITSQGLEATIKAVSRPGRRLILVAGIPLMHSSITPMCSISGSKTIWRRECSLDDTTVTRSHFEARQRSTYEMIEEVSSNTATLGTIGVYPADGMCDQHLCGSTFNGEFVYRDPTHIRRNLSLETNDYLADIFGLKNAIAGALK